jgi:hypothetical protein
MKMLIGLVAGLLLTAGAAWGGDYTVNPNGTVSDNTTGLIWQQEDDNTGRTWEQALAYCENLTLDSQADWRLPNIKELESIADDSRVFPAIDTAAFPNTDSSGCWSSTTYAGYTDLAWYVDFYDGNVYIDDKYGSYYARCVRGGQ